jgi:hypothetical protein
MLNPTGFFDRNNANISAREILLEISSNAYSTGRRIASISSSARRSLPNGCHFHQVLEIGLDWNSCLLKTVDCADHGSNDTPGVSDLSNGTSSGHDASA